MLKKSLYRSLLRQSKKFDQNPRMKAFIFTSDATFPRDTNEDATIEYVIKDGSEKAMKDLVQSFCGTGTFYKPTTSLVTFMKEAFRQPPAGLDKNQLDQLGFMAVRQLFNCEALALSVSAPAELLFNNTPAKNTVIAVEPAVPEVTSTEVETVQATAVVPSVQALSLEPFSITHTDVVQVGSLIVSHPLRTEDTFGSAVILVTHTSDNHSSGLILNRDFKENFKSRLTKAERVKRGVELRPFFEMPCFYGGDGEHNHPFNFCILHRQPSLAGVSQRIDVSESTSGSLAAVGFEDSTTEGEAGSFVYMSHDFRAVGKAINEGTVKTTDLKIVEGVTEWLEQELQREMTQHRAFAVRTSAAPSIAMVPPAPDMFDRSSYHDTWQLPSVWYSGHYTYSKLLTLMGGEYSDFSRLQRIRSIPQSSLYMRILHTLPGFDLKMTYEDLSGDSDGSDFDEYDSEDAMYDRAVTVEMDLRGDSLLESILEQMVEETEGEKDNNGDSDDSDSDDL